MNTTTLSITSIYVHFAIIVYARPLKAKTDLYRLFVINALPVISDLPANHDILFVLIC